MLIFLILIHRHIYVVARSSGLDGTFDTEDFASHDFDGDIFANIGRNLITLVLLVSRLAELVLFL